jgi:putative heme degradation protein
VLDAVREAGTPVVVGFRQPGFWQAFRGVVETVKPAMGFINIMRADFHLHLKSGAVAEWREVDGERRAVNADGQELDLYLTTVQ